MIISIHQPHFLPWMGYFNKVLNSDIFVWLPDVQYRKNYYQNRTKIKNVNGLPLWLTLPVHAKLGMPIDKVLVAEPDLYKRVTKTLTQCYQKTRYFTSCWPNIYEAMRTTSSNLDQINYETFLAIMDLLDAHQIKVVRVEDLQLATTDPTGRLVEICRACGGTRYIAGRGGRIIWR